MSRVSQTSAQAAPSPIERIRRIVLPLAAVGLAVALLPLAGGIVRAASGGRLRAPDWGLLAAQPLVIQLHLAAAALALVIGAMLMLMRKGVTFHRRAGWVWVGAMSIVAGSSIFITGVNGDHWSFIHMISGWTLITLPLAVIAARRHNVKQHRRFMMGMFYGGLIIAGGLTFIPGRTMWNVFFA
ncbi:MAG: DUF2306 domain-containing protein [Phenylobacterium sp.]|nr:DUF2306 domain-containing protein [Phenylobacterium sp.]MBP7817593.1 DUF2306 domain-containing protein [Phenylobacterium sp.]MBP9231416.1 DUF2306 domain-containing protein [Phenylobacterium sp.]MBP9755383.1 DUF2306 domain-containing protein [Phenylobacterium sp.]